MFFRVLLSIILVLTLTAPASADSGMESQFLSSLNSARASNGAPALSVAGDLTSVARSHSRVMADSGNLHHNPSLGSAVSGWQKVGENVGRGPSVSSIHSALMNSPGHKRNMLDPAFTQVGIGVVVDGGGQVWVTQVFRQPVGAAPKPAPKPEPKPEPAPQPAPQPEPQPQQAAQPEPEPDPMGRAEAYFVDEPWCGPSSPVVCLA